MASTTTSFTREVWNLLVSNPNDILDWLHKEVTGNPVHVTVEVLCLVFIFYMWGMKPHKRHAIPPGEEPTREEKDELIRNWKCAAYDKHTLSEFEVEGEKEMVVVGYEGNKIDVEGVGLCKDFSTFNHLGFATHDKVIKNSLEAVDHYGVGSCGPRGFYGTIQPHLVLEEQLKKCYGTQAAIIYSFQYNTLASIIPAFAGRSDIIVADKGINMGISNGVFLSRSKLHWYDNNDYSQLEEHLKSIAAKQGANPTRRWIVTEGTFRNTGEITDLKKLIELKKRYKFRLMLDDTYSMGVLGKTGLGICEENGIPTSEVDVYVGGMDTVLGSIGGFCVGSNTIVDHQRLSSVGYCFSASLPPFSAVASSTALEIMSESSSSIATLRKNCLTARLCLSKSGLSFTNSEKSAIFHITFPASSSLSRPAQEETLSKIVADLLSKGIAVTRSKYSLSEPFPPKPSIRLTMSAAFTESEVRESMTTICETVKSAMAK
eukprot:TRINITY_DN6076_c3_g1_i1.p1 TRINITY_DN6076_c3_g1~~TRINITY_DN6076_c3_g1_i1.p1  ORF type:complete len:488 (+),score=79.49 TRINITY_DN6076_c3_g1_i1:89-1552(+)